MTNGQRAKIFTPYAALRGFGDYIEDAECREEARVELAEDAQEELDRRLQALRPGQTVTLRFYEGGRYRELTGALGRVDPETRTLRLGARQIPLAEIVDVKKIKIDIDNSGFI